MMSYRRGRLFLKLGEMMQPKIPSSPCLPSNVSSFLFENLTHSLINGILLHTPYYDNDRFTLATMGSRKEATKDRGLKSNKAYAWKRRQKRGCSTGPSYGLTEPHTECLVRTEPQTGRRPEAPVHISVQPSLEPKTPAFVLCYPFDFVTYSPLSP
jgi:hypothetical protein